MNTQFYNSQEIGLAKAFVRKGYSCDIVFYTKREERIEKIDGPDIQIFWKHGFVFANNTFYRSVFKMINKYDIIISMEYCQIMTVILSLFAKNKLIVYHGPYRDGKHKCFYRLFDVMFMGILKRRVNNLFAKSKLAEIYLRKKGFVNPITIGVGLNTENLSGNVYDKYDTNTILYIGKLEERRNIRFIFEVLKELLAINPNYQLIIIGMGNKGNIESYFNYAEQLNVHSRVFYKTSVPQNELVNYYNKASFFILPTDYEIFGMVMLESMFFGLPVITTYNGGSSLLINNNKNGFIMHELKAKDWAITINEAIKSKNYANMRRAARSTILDNFMWDNIASKMLDNYTRKLNEGVTQ